jgi:predicted site-specific integrase-resolvase
MTKTNQGGLLEDMPDLLSPSQVAEFLQISTSTLASWRSSKNGKIPYCKIGNKVFYMKADIETFIEENMVR